MPSHTPKERAKKRGSSHMSNNNKKNRGTLEVKVTIKKKGRNKKR